MYFYKNNNGIVISNNELELDGLLRVNSVDAAVEKHVPLIATEDNKVTVTVGEVLHPMLEEHYIEFIVIETNKGYQVHYLKPGEEPIATFMLNDNEQLLNAYSYCNLHGLWISSNN